MEFYPVQFTLVDYTKCVSLADYCRVMTDSHKLATWVDEFIERVRRKGHWVLVNREWEGCEDRRLNLHITFSNPRVATLFKLSLPT